MQPKATETQAYDVVVIGAGINGTSAARELVKSGYSVLLVDKGDFASGASSRSSRILHCGLRYFETPSPVWTFARYPTRLFGAVRMARAGMLARAEMNERLPERCKPFTMCFPGYSGSDVKGWHLDAAFALLKRLGPREPGLEYRRLTRDFSASLPFAADLRDRDRLSFVATYREYIMDWPDRMCVDAALEAEASGADIRLFHEASVIGTDSSGWQLELREVNGGGKSLVRGTVMLNMAGTWIDVVQGEGTRRGKTVRGTKGAHIAVRLPARYLGFGIATVNRKGMPFYCLPSHDDFFYIGPTETPFDGDATDVAADDRDIQFLLGEANHMLPGLSLGRGSVEFTWAGVRPLTFDPDQPMGRRTREIHDLGIDGGPRAYAMTAGPVMTHLSAGRQMRRKVQRRLRAPGSGRSVTRPMAVGHAPLRTISGGPSALTLSDVRHAVLGEKASDLKGLLFTRTGVAWRGHMNREEVERVAELMAGLLQWSPDRAASEVEGFVQYQKRVFRNGKAASTSTTETETAMGELNDETTCTR